MAMIEIPTYRFKGVEVGGRTALLIEVTLPEGATTPDAFARSLGSLTGLTPPGAGAVISGRMPIWGAAMLCHLFHPASWVATYDPRLGGGVVVQSHVPEVRVGEVLALELPNP